MTWKYDGPARVRSIQVKMDDAMWSALDQLVKREGGYLADHIRLMADDYLIKAGIEWRTGADARADG